MRIFILIIALSQIFISCGHPDSFPKLKFEFIQVPSLSSGQSRLFTNHIGETYLSWIEYEADTSYTFQYSKLEKSIWSSPVTIKNGKDWFVNWADFPSLIQSKNGDFAAHWLEMRGDGTYEYDVHIALSNNGKDWNKELIPHRDSLAAEHGFVSMSELENGDFIVVWLDGRNTVSTNHQHSNQMGAMTLRTASISANGKLYNEYELDQRICDCCQTDISVTREGPIAVFRDRSKSEVRDISVVRVKDSVWMDPAPVHNDDWVFPACPVNGPSIETLDNHVGVLWYTGVNNNPKVQLSISEDFGANFGSPIKINEQKTLGRVDLTKWDNERFIATWIEERDEQMMIMARLINREGNLSQSYPLAEISSSRLSGFPIISSSPNGAILTWTEVSKGKTKVLTGIIQIDS